MFEKSMVNPQAVPKDETLKQTQIPYNPTFLKQYELLGLKDIPYKINTFHQIGWPDPYPSEDFFTTKTCQPKNKDDLVYDENRLNPGEIPFCVFLPRPEMMFKMMRACVELGPDEALWCEQMQKLKFE